MFVLFLGSNKEFNSMLGWKEIAEEHGPGYSKEVQILWPLTPNVQSWFKILYLPECRWSISSVSLFSLLILSVLFSYWHNSLSLLQSDTAASCWTLPSSSSLTPGAAPRPSTARCWTTACSVQGPCREAWTPARCVSALMQWWSVRQEHRQDVQKTPLFALKCIFFSSSALPGRLRRAAGVREQRNVLHRRRGELGRRLRPEEQARRLRQRQRLHQLDQEPHQLKVTELKQRPDSGGGGGWGKESRHESSSCFGENKTKKRKKNFKKFIWFSGYKPSIFLPSPALR